VNRIALHQSTVHPMDPIRQVEVVREAGVDSIGLRVAAVDDAEEWWAHGLGSPVLHRLIEALLASRVTVLDVGRVHLGPELRVVDGRHGYVRALEIGVRLGAQFVTARVPDGSPDDPAELFALLAELAGRYGLRALLVAVPGTAVATAGDAARIVAGTDGGVVLDVSPTHAPDAVADAVAELGTRLGYVRVPAAALLAGPPRPGLLATLPPQVPVAIGAAPADRPGAPGPVHDDDPVATVAALRASVDAMLRHPQASTAR
jgi:hypothetical protein